MIKYDNDINFDLYEELIELIYLNQDIKGFVHQRTKKSGNLERFSVVKERFNPTNSFYEKVKKSLKAEEYEFLKKQMSKELAIDWIIRHCKEKAEKRIDKSSISKNDRKNEINLIIFTGCERISKTVRFITSYKETRNSDYSWGIVNALKICYGFGLSIKDSMAFLETCGSYIDLNWFKIDSIFESKLFDKEEKELINRRIKEICCIYSVLNNKETIGFDEIDFLKLLDIASTEELDEENDKIRYRFLQDYVKYLKENSIKKKLKSFLDKNEITHSDIYGFVYEPKDILYSKPDDTIMLDELLWLLYSIKHYEIYAKPQKFPKEEIDILEFVHAAGYSVERANLSYEEIALLYLIEHPEIDYQDAVDTISRFGSVFDDEDYKTNRDDHDRSRESYKDSTNYDFYKDILFSEHSVKNHNFLKKILNKKEEIIEENGFLFFETSQSNIEYLRAFVDDLYEFILIKTPTYICRYEGTKFLIFFKNIQLSDFIDMIRKAVERYKKHSVSVQSFKLKANEKKKINELYDFFNKPKTNNAVQKEVA